MGHFSFLAKIINYEEIGRKFVTEYYARFDNQATRANIGQMYHVGALMKFNGVLFDGSAKIMEKIQSLTFQKIAHVITAVDVLPTNDGRILINVLGQLEVTGIVPNQPQSFTQTFVLKQHEVSSSCWWIQEEIFRLV